MTAITVTAANVRAMTENGAVTRIGTAGGTLTVGNAVYLGSAGTWIAAQANAVGTATGRGIAVASKDSSTSIASGDPVTVCLFGPVEGFSGMTPGGKVWISNTVAGGVDDAAAGTAHELGWSASATCVFVNPDAAGAGS